MVASQRAAKPNLNVEVLFVFQYTGQCCGVLAFTAIRVHSRGLQCLNFGS